MILRNGEWVKEPDEEVGAEEPDPEPEENDETDALKQEIASLRLHTTRLLETLARERDERIDLLKLDLASAQRELFTATASEWLPRVRTLVIDVGNGALSTRDPFRSAFDAVPHRRYHLVDRLVIDFA